MQLSTLQKQFACARLSRPCLPGSSPDFSATFTTIAFDDSSLRWLGISDLIAEPEGPSFISRTVTQPPCGPALLVTQDPSCVSAPLLDPGRTDVPLPWRSHRCCPRVGKNEGFGRYEFRGSFTQLQHLLSYA